MFDRRAKPAVGAYRLALTHQVVKRARTHAHSQRCHTHLRLILYFAEKVFHTTDCNARAHGQCHEVASAIRYVQARGKGGCGRGRMRRRGRARARTRARTRADADESADEGGDMLISAPQAILRFQNRIWAINRSIVKDCCFLVSSHQRKTVKCKIGLA